MLHSLKPRKSGPLSSVENLLAVFAIQAFSVLPSISSKKFVCAAKVGEHVVVFGKSRVGVIDSNVVYEDLFSLSSKAAHGVLKEIVLHSNYNMMVHNSQISLVEALSNDKRGGNLAFVA